MLHAPIFAPMKRILPALALLPFLFISCKKKMVDCTAKAYKAPCYVAFKGFAKTEVDTIIRNIYLPGEGFKTRTGSDTLPFPEVFLYSDTAYSTPARTHMSALGAGADYELIVPSASKVYRITNIAYPADSVIKWTAEKTCGTYGTFILHPVSVSVNGTGIYTGEVTHNSTQWMVLQR